MTEIEAMLIGELPDLEETQSGKDLIAVGEERGLKEGKKEGKTQTILLCLEAKHGTVPRELRQSIAELASAKANRLIAFLPQSASLEEVQAWLDKNS